MRSFLVIILFLFSCEDSYELVVQPELNQKMYFKFNGTISFPESGFTKKIDPDKDKFEIMKIKYVPISKWYVAPAFENDDKYSKWGQAGIAVQIKKTNSLFMSDEIIYQEYIEHFFNPTINNATVLIYNEDSGNSGLNMGSGSINSPFYSDNSTNALILQLPFSGREKHFTHTLIKKSASESNFNEDFLYSSSLEKCTIIFPFDSVRYKELKNLSF